jgi:hypothetical protein
MLKWNRHSCSLPSFNVLWAVCDQPSQVFGGKEMNGVMTYLLTKIIREHSGITYGSLLEKLHEDIGKIQQSKHFNGFFKRIFYSRIDQVGLYHILYMLLLLRSIYIIYTISFAFYTQLCFICDIGKETSYICDVSMKKHWYLRFVSPY